MDSQEETVSIQRFEIGIHKDLPIKETIFFFLGGGGKLRSTFERFFFLFLFLTFFYFRQIEASIGGRGKMQVNHINYKRSK